MSGEQTPIVLNVNGKTHEVDVFPTDTLADTLREKLGLYRPSMIHFGIREQA